MVFKHKNWIDFCHIAPTAHLDLVDGRPVHLVLAHLIEEDNSYAQWYVDQKAKYDCTLIMDNSAFEMYKQNKPMYDPSKLIDMGKKVQADYIVLSDYPGHEAMETIEAATIQAPVFKEYGFGTFFVPQGKKGDLNDLLYSFKFAMNNPDVVDYIGISILAAPLAFDVEQGNNLQRFNSRLRLMYELDRIGWFEKILKNFQKIHMLGMLDGPNEIMFMKQFRKYIDTWDSSAAVWLGLNNETFDNSPTGRMDGKFEKEVDFDWKTEDTESLTKAIENMAYIDYLCKES